MSNYEEHLKLNDGNVELIGNNLIIHSKKIIYELDDEDKVKVADALSKLIKL